MQIFLESRGPFNVSLFDLKAISRHNSASCMVISLEEDCASYHLEFELIFASLYYEAEFCLCVRSFVLLNFSETAGHKIFKFCIS